MKSGAGPVSGGRRDVKALAHTFEATSWKDTVAEDGLIAMALGYRNQFYKGVQEEA